MMNFSTSRLLKAAIGAGIILTIMVIGAMMLMSGGAASSGKRVVAEVNGEPIAEAEFKRSLLQQRSAVIDYFKRTYGAKVDADFWQKDYNGETPAEKAKEWALEAAVRLRLQLELAAAKGVISDASYEGLLNEMERENARRSAAVKADQPIYGPVQFEETGFVEFYVSRIVSRLKDIAAEQELTLNDEQLLRHYEQIKDEFFKLEGTVHFTSVTISYRDDGQRKYSGLKQEAEQAMGAIMDEWQAGGPAETALLQLEDIGAGLDARLATEVFDSHTARQYYKSLPQLYEWLADQPKAAAISPLMDNLSTGEYVAAYVSSSEAGGYKSFAEQKETVRSHYLNTKLNAYLDTLREEADVTIRDEVFDQIKVQDYF